MNRKILFAIFFILRLFLKVFKICKLAKARRRGKNQVVKESKVAEEIVVQRMSADVGGKQQKYSCIGAQEYVPF